VVCECVWVWLASSALFIDVTGKQVFHIGQPTDVSQQHHM
jgi:hypothetical protein